MASMTTTNTHGGKRPGAGLKPSGKQPRNITRSVKLTADEAAYISEFGTGELWRLLQASKHFQEWQQLSQFEEPPNDHANNNPSPQASPNPHPLYKLPFATRSPPHDASRPASRP